MTILQKITGIVFIFLTSSRLHPTTDLITFAEVFSELLKALAGKTGAEILISKNAEISKAFEDPTGIDTTPGSALILLVEKAIAELEEELIQSTKVQFGDTTDSEKNIKTKKSIFNYAKIDIKTIQDPALSAEIAEIQKNIKSLYTINNSRKKLTHLGHSTLKNLPNKLAQYATITHAQTDRRKQIKQLYKTAITTKGETQTKAKQVLTSLAAEYARLEGIVDSLPNLIASIKGELQSFTKSTVSSHIEDTLIKQLEEIAKRPIYPFTKEQLATKIADKATGPGDKSLYKQMLTNLEATDALIADVQRAINTTKDQLGDGEKRINTIYEFVVDMRNKVTKNEPGAQQYMDESKFKFVPGTIKNIFSSKLQDITKSKGTEEIFKGGSQPGDTSPTDPKKFTPPEIKAIQLIPGGMLTFASEPLNALTEFGEGNLDTLISRQEIVDPQKGAESRATFNKIKEIRLELKQKKLTGDGRKQYVAAHGTGLSEEIRTALAGESEWN